MKKCLRVLTIGLLFAFFCGCGSDKEKDMNRHRDMPRAAPSEDEKGN
jgi:hypothetical protein